MEMVVGWYLPALQQWLSCVDTLLWKEGKKASSDWLDGRMCQAATTPQGATIVT